MNAEQPPVRRGATALYSDAVLYAGSVYLVEVPETECDDIREQSRSLLAALERTLRGAGSGKDALLMVTVYLVDMADYDVFNAVWRAWLPAGCAPARACVRVVELARPGWKVEVAAVAAVLHAPVG